MNFSVIPDTSARQVQTGETIIFPTFATFGSILAYAKILVISLPNEIHEEEESYTIASASNAQRKQRNGKTITGRQSGV